MASAGTVGFVPVEVRYLKAARVYAQLSQSGLAQRLGISKESMKRREARGELRPAELLALPLICNVPAEFFERGFEGATWTPDAKPPALPGPPAELRPRGKQAQRTTPQKR